ncbi:sulfatase-like hydrolase/transferase [Arcanobacterium canis]
MIVAIQIFSIVGLIVGAVSLFGRASATVTRGAAVARGLSAGIIANALTFLGATFIPDGVFVYGTPHTVMFSLLYGAVVIAVGGAILVAMNYAFHNWLRAKPAAWRARNIFPIIIGAVIGALVALFFFVPKAIADSVDNVTAAQLTFIFTQGNGQTTGERALEFSNWMVAPVVWFALMGACIGLIRSDFVTRPRYIQAPNISETLTSNRFRYVRAVAMSTMLALLAGSITYAFQVLPLGDVLRQRFLPSTYIAEHFVEATNSKVTFPQKKRNLIHIYMESIENSFYSRDMGGYLDHNIMPHLAELTKRGVQFSNTDHYGGPQQMYATGHSVAAMVAMWAGTPMLASGAGNGSQMSFPDFRSIGDFLHEDGYTTDFMLGSDSRWAGLGDYYRRHGNFTVHDINTFKAEGRIPPDYHVWWGVEDDKVYEYAKELMTKRASEDKPFYFILENADTHFPDGYLSPKMKERPFKTQYENVIYYSQEQTVKLVEWIQSQPWAQDTTIVITGDHRSMDKNFFKTWDKDYNRTVVNVILNPVQGTNLPPSITQNRLYGSYDFYPTILAAIGAHIEGERLGLGTNLFSGVPTLLEKDGVAHLNEEFAKRSNFYDSHRETVAATPDRRQDDKL